MGASGVARADGLVRNLLISAAAFVIGANRRGPACGKARLFTVLVNLKAAA
jgi:hypothetical protein